MFQNMNMMNAQKDFEEARKVCGEHPECDGCPMIEGIPLEIENRKIVCETGKGKRRD